MYFNIFNFDLFEAAQKCSANTVRTFANTEFSDAASNWVLLER